MQRLIVTSPEHKEGLVEQDPEYLYSGRSRNTSFGEAEFPTHQLHVDEAFCQVLTN